MKIKAIVFLFIVFSVLGSVVYLKATGKHFSMPSPQGAPSENSKLPHENLQTYGNANFTVFYPDPLTATQKGSAVVIAHSIPYAHPDPCNLKGESKPLADLTDFNISLVMDTGDFQDIVTRNEGSDYIAKNFFIHGALIESPEIVDPFNVGSLVGFQITSGVEGCGRLTYYFPDWETGTLVVNRALISEFNPINATYKTYLQLPGIISPDEEQKLFVEILSSFKIK